MLVSSGVTGIDRTSRLGFSIVVPSDVQNNGLTLAAVPFQLHCVTIIQTTVYSWMTTAEWQWPHALLPKTWGYQEKHPWDPNFAWDPLTASKTRSTKPVKVVQCCDNLELWQQDWCFTDWQSPWGVSGGTPDSLITFIQILKISRWFEVVVEVGSVQTRDACDMSSPRSRWLHTELNVQGA